MNMSETLALRPRPTVGAGDTVQAPDAMQVIALADQALARGDAAASVHIYEQWLQGSASPLRHVVLFNLGVLLTQQNRLADAEARYREAITTRPDFAQAWFNLASTIERSGRREHAVIIWQSMAVQATTRRCSCWPRSASCTRRCPSRRRAAAHDQVPAAQRAHRSATCRATCTCTRWAC
jgi:predicted O-linked N-acetylglucosamine transferase (SPINDLY family)